LEKAALTGSLPKVVIPVHLAGQSCDMKSIYALSQRYGFAILEDASHAIGGRYNGEPIGNCKFSDITIFSFHPVKIITTGEGGAVVTNSAPLADHLRLLRSHGITRDPGLMSKVPDGPWYYEQIDLGFNFRMTDIQAALGLSQFSRLDSYVLERNCIADFYDSKLSKLSLCLPNRSDMSYSAFHLYIIRLNLGELNSKSHHDVFVELQNKGVGVNLHYIPVHLQPYYRKLGFELGDFPQAEAYYSEAISLPIYPTLSVDDKEYVIQALTEVLA
jgi:dTDP-4-amino-4,6-dideoxygalactose transaminase